MSERKVIPLCIPYLHGNELAYVTKCIEDNWVSSVGAYVDKFEDRFGARLGFPRAVATVNGTAALHIALKVAGVGVGDLVIVSDLTFIAPANAIRHLGAEPVFIDAEPNHWQMDVAQLGFYLETACERRGGGAFDKASGKRIAAIVPVHILGHPVDMDPLMVLAQDFAIPVIEDATESLGAQYLGQQVGTHGDASCFSFNGNKLITTGGGGMIASMNEDFLNTAKHLTTQAKQAGTEYIHDEVGYNYRLVNVLAAMGVAQLEQLDGFVEKKRAIAKTYRAAFATIPGITAQAEADWASSADWLFSARIDQDAFGMDSRALILGLKACGIESRPLWQPMHLSPAHAGALFIGTGVSKALFESVVSLPCSVGLTAGEQNTVIGAIKDLAGG